MRARRLIPVGLGALFCVAGFGLVLAQDLSPPPPPGYIPGVGYAPSQGGPPPGPVGPPPPGPPVSEGPPPEEAIAPPPHVQVEGNATAEAEPIAPPVKKPDPMKRPRYASAILQAVDTTTAETLRFEAKIGEPVRYKGLVMTVHACEATAPDEGYNDSFAHIDVQSQPEGLSKQDARVVFRGWMFASSPGLHPVEHPLYDVWLIACKTAAPAAAGVKL